MIGQHAKMRSLSVSEIDIIMTDLISKRERAQLGVHDEVSTPLIERRHRGFHKLCSAKDPGPKPNNLGERKTLFSCLQVLGKSLCFVIASTDTVKVETGEETKGRFRKRLVELWFWRACPRSGFFVPGGEHSGLKKQPKHKVFGRDIPGTSGTQTSGYPGQKLYASGLFLLF